MTHNTQMHLLLPSELIFALRTNDPETFKRWLAGGIQDLGKPAIEELMIEWLNPLLKQNEADRRVGWHLGVCSNQFLTNTSPKWGRYNTTI